VLNATHRIVELPRQLINDDGIQAGQSLVGLAIGAARFPKVIEHDVHARGEAVSRSRVASCSGVQKNRTVIKLDPPARIADLQLGSTFPNHKDIAADHHPDPTTAINSTAAVLKIESRERFQCPIFSETFLDSFKPLSISSHGAHGIPTSSS
jgi:hypothetical protein